MSERFEWANESIQDGGLSSYIRSLRSRIGIRHSVLSSETCNSLTNFSWIGDRRLRPPERLSVGFMISLNVAKVEELLASS
jgi:hypothetical protein